MVGSRKGTSTVMENNECSLIMHTVHQVSFTQINTYKSILENGPSISFPFPRLTLSPELSLDFMYLLCPCITISVLQTVPKFVESH